MTITPTCIYVYTCTFNNCGSNTRSLINLEKIKLLVEIKFKILILTQHTEHDDIVI